MKKRILALIMGLVMVAALAGCGKEEGVSNEKIVISQYKGMDVEDVAVAEVTDTDIESDIQYTITTIAAEIAEEHGIKDRAAELGDSVVIDYVGTWNGEAFEGGTGTDYVLELGSGTFIDGFEDGIVGHTPGETFDLNLTFPEDYSNNEELAGQDVVFTVTFKAIVPTELTDALATYICGTETTVEEYKQQVKESLAASNAETAESEYQSNVLYAVIENCTIEEYPEDELAETISTIESEYSWVTYYGLDVASYFETYYGVTVEEVAKERLCWEYAVELIAEKEGITVTLEEYEEKLAEIAESYGYESAEEYETAYEEAYGEGSLKDALLQEIVCEWLVENNNRVEATAETE